MPEKAESKKATAAYKVIKATDYADTFDETHAFAVDILVGLSELKKSIPSKYLYDSRGSNLFRQITHLDEYYPTACEIEILKKYADEIGDIAGGQPFNLVELGAGFGRKTQALIKRFLQAGLNLRYVPIDISESAMSGLIDAIREQFPGLNAYGLVSDYFAGLKWLNNRFDERNFVLFLGSSIGNFTHAEARIFLRNAWNCLKHDDLMLIGFDLKKDIEMLLRAYNDSRGVTREFNLNVLRRINNELGGTFDLNKFRHFGTYDVFSGAMESYLVSLEKQSVYIDLIGRSFDFEAWEPIHTEYSYKYLISDIELLAEETGFAVAKHFFDTRRFFTDSVWTVVKDSR
jgi:dimethylhistidine N-methyltransferase